MPWYIQTLECYPDCFCAPHESFGLLFWSSGAYFLSALFIYLRCREKSHAFELWVLCVMALALSSFLFHSTLSRISVALDYASIMLVLIFFPLWQRLSILPPRAKEVFIFTLYVLSWGIFLQLPKWQRIGLSVAIFLMVIFTIRKEVIRLRFHRQLLVSVWLGIGSFLFFLAEELRVACAVNGHAVWHIGSATALYYYGRWRFRFKDGQKGRA